MSYSFPSDLSDIKSFYQSGGSYFSTLLPQMAQQMPIAHIPDLQTDLVQAVNQQSASFSFLLRKMIPVMLCTAWETFGDDLKIQEPARHAKHFTPMTKWHSEAIREISLLRHCIIHNSGKIDQEYLDGSRQKTFTVVGETIDFTDEKLDSFFEIFKDAYATVMT